MINMKAIKLIIELDDGSVSYLDDALIIRAVGLQMPKNLPWKSGASGTALRNKYFQMLTELHKNKATDHTKADLHEALKPLLMHKFKDFPQYFTTGVPEYSTQHLTREGWIALIEQLKSVVVDIYGYIFN